MEASPGVTAGNSASTRCHSCGGSGYRSPPVAAGPHERGGASVAPAQPVPPDAAAAAKGAARVEAVGPAGRIHII